MNEEVNKELLRITKGVPKHLQKELMHDVVDTSEEEMMNERLKDKNIPSDKRKELSRLVEKGAFRRVETVEDERVIKEIDKYYTKKVNAARRDGRLPDPMEDKFFRDRMKKTRR